MGSKTVTQQTRSQYGYSNLIKNVVLIFEIPFYYLKFMNFCITNNTYLIMVSLVGRRFMCGAPK